MATNDEILGYARQIHVDGKTVKQVARQVGCGEKWVLAKVRTQLPRLISEQGWGIKESIEKLGGTCLPLEMRKECVRVRTEHGLSEAMRRTGVSESSLIRWCNGEVGDRRALKMGTLPWKGKPGVKKIKMAKPADETAEDSPVPEREPVKARALAKSKHGRRGRGNGVDPADVRIALYRWFSGKTDPHGIAEEHGVAYTTVYNWRKDAVGLATADQFVPNIERFIAEVAEELGEDALPYESSDKGPSRRKESDSGRSGNRVVKCRNQYDLSLKEKAVHALVNHRKRLADVSAEFDVSGVVIRSWRSQLLGNIKDPGFDDKAKALARKMLDAAAEEDALSPAATQPQVNEELVRSPIDSAGVMLDEVTRMQPVALADALAEIDRRAADLAKDRTVITQQLEIQRLRRALQQQGS